MLAVLLAAAFVAEAPRPNVVFLLIDDLGRHDCGFMGGKEIKTPHLDRLAASGTILDAHYVQPVCSPTRAALMTGRYPMRHGLQVGVVRPQAQYGLPLEERTLAQALGEAGYATGIFGKWHLGHHQRAYLPTQRGFQRQYGHYMGMIDCWKHTRDGGFDWHRDDKECRDEGHSTNLIADEACKFIAQHAGKQPFLCYLPFNAVHNPLQAADQYLARYPNLQGQRRNYAAMLTELDDAIGRVIAAVDAAGQRERTLFVFSADNGGPAPGKVTDNGPFRAGKGTLYEGGVRGVAFAAWKGKLRPGGLCSEPLHMVDWFPTLCGLAGVKAEAKLALDGRDLWPTVAEGKPSPHDAILLNTTPNSGALRMGDWKLVAVGEPDDHDATVPAAKKKGKKAKQAAATLELFNLRNDPYEKHNLAEAEREKLAALKAKLAEFAAQAVPPKAAPPAPGFKTPRVWGEP